MQIFYYASNSVDADIWQWNSNDSDSRKMKSRAYSILLTLAHILSKLGLVNVHDIVGVVTCSMLTASVLDLAGYAHKYYEHLVSGSLRHIFISSGRGL